MRDHDDPAGVRIQAPVRVPMATLAPLACMVHCLATPLLLVLAPPLAGNRGIEAALIAVASVVGLAAMSRGIRMHHHWWVVVPFGAGVVLWIVALLDTRPLVPERALMVVAGILVAGAIYWDARMRPGHDCH